MVAFTDKISKPDNCYSSELAVATPHTKKKIQNFIDNLVASGESDLKPPFEVAFDLFSASRQPPILHSSQTNRCMSGTIII